MTCRDRCGVSLSGRECGGNFKARTQIATGWNSFSATRNARGNCRETRMQWGGCCGTAEFFTTMRRAATSARGAISRILDMIEGLEIDPRQIVAAIDGRNAATMATPLLTQSPTLPTIFTALPLGHIAAEDGTDLISRWAKEIGIRPRGIYQARLDMAKFVALIGHDDATHVTPQDIVRFKEHLADKGLRGTTINRSERDQVAASPGEREPQGRDQSRRGHQI